jgi:hypothetical protein
VLSPDEELTAIPRFHPASTISYLAHEVPPPPPHDTLKFEYACYPEKYT